MNTSNTRGVVTTNNQGGAGAGWIILLVAALALFLGYFVLVYGLLGNRSGVEAPSVVPQSTTETPPSHEGG